MKFIVHEKDREYEFLLANGLYIAGRDPTCDLTLDSRRVSRRHMSCTVTEGQVQVKDMGSRNGIAVGGVQVREAVLRDGDEVQIGDVVLEFQGAAGVAPPAPEKPVVAAAVEPAPAAEAEVVDSESTPPEGNLLPAKAADVRPQLIQRDGRWFVVDPATGREVEIVPAQQAKAPAGRKSLLSTAKGKLIIGGLAIIVTLILVAAVIKTSQPQKPIMTDAQYKELIGNVLKGEQTGELAAVFSGRQYSDVIKRSLDALDRGDTMTAARLAVLALKSRPKDETARRVVELVRVWDDWKKDFWTHWQKVQGILEDLYEGDASPAVQEFTKTYKDFIDKERAYSQYADEARKQYAAKKYEEAWQDLLHVPEGSPVRERDAVLFENVKGDFKHHIEEQMKSASVRQDWTEARKWAEKLRDYYAADKERAQENLTKYSEYEGHASLMQQAKDALAKNDFADADRFLRSIPEGSPYYAEAQRLLQRAKADEVYARALALYNQGASDEALKSLEGQDSAAARTLKLHVESMLALYNKARDAQKKLELLDAEQYWQQLTETETDDNNQYRKEGLRELARMKDLRRNYARELIEGGDDAFKTEQFEKARTLYKKATDMDPDGRMGMEPLARMEQQGRMDYRRALVKEQTDPKAALQLLERACRMLPPDDKYYTWALDKKQEIERKLEGK